MPKDGRLVQHFEQAQQNGVELRRKYRELLGNANSSGNNYGAALESFFDRVKASKHISINIRAKQLEDFIKDRIYKNIHRLFDESKVRKKRDYDVRVFIEKQFGYDVVDYNLNYGALNTGNDGPRVFGKLCLVLGKMSKFNLNVLLFPRNTFSLVKKSILSGELPAPHGDDLRKQLVRWEDAEYLAVLKHADLIKTKVGSFSYSEIDNILITWNEYIEAHIFEDICPEDVEEIRISIGFYSIVFAVKGLKSEGLKITQSLWDTYTEYMRTLETIRRGAPYIPFAISE